MITIHTLASGSEGNAALVCAGDVHILVDAGISARRIETALRALNRLPQALSAVFITHTHSDHTAGVGNTQFSVKVFCQFLGNRHGQSV